MVQAIAGEAAKLLMEDLTARHFREGNPRCSSTGARRQYLRRSSAGRTEAGGGSEGSLDKCCQEDEALAKALEGWVPMLVCCGVQKFWASSLLSSTPSGWTPPKPPSASVKDRKRSPRCWPARSRQGQRTSIGPAHTKNKSCWRGQRVHGKGCQILTQRRRPCKQPLPGSAAWPRMLRPPSCLRCCGWDGAPSLPGISPPTMARRSTSWVLHHRPWATGSTRQLWSGQTVPHIGATPKGRCSGRQSDPCWLLGNWKDGPSRTEMCWSSWSHTASGHRTGSPGFEVGTTFASFATRAQARSTSDRLCRESGTFAPRRSCGGRRARWSRNTEQFARGCFRCPSPILPMGARQLGRAHLHRRIHVGQWHSAARRLWSPSTIWETSSRWLAERYQSTSSPNAAILAGPITTDPLTLQLRGHHRDYQRAEVFWPLEPKGKGFTSGAAFFCSHDEVAAVKVNGHATEADVQAGAVHSPVPTWKQFRRCVRKRGRRHTQAAFARGQNLSGPLFPGQASCALGDRSACGPAITRLERHAGYFRAKDKGAPRKNKGKAEARRDAGSASGRSGCRPVGAVHTRELLAQQ